MNRRGTFLGDQMSMKNCVEFTAYPVNYASENAPGNLMNSRLPGIKPPRRQRIAPRPSSVDVYAVAKAGQIDPVNRYGAANTIVALERTKIKEERNIPIKPFRPRMTAAEQFAIYGGVEESVLARIGITEQTARDAFDPMGLGGTQDGAGIRQAIQDSLDELQAPTIAPTFARGATLSEQMLQQLKGVRTEVENLRLEIDQRAIDTTLQQRIDMERTRLVGQSKPQLQTILQQAIASRAASGLGDLPAGSIKTASQRQQSRKDQLLNEILLYYTEEQRTILENASQANVSVPIRLFKRSYEGISVDDREEIRRQMIEAIQNEEALSSGDEVRALLGNLDIDTLVDYFKDNRLALPDLGQFGSLGEVGLPAEPDKPEEATVVGEESTAIGTEDPSQAPEGVTPPEMRRDPGTGDVLM